MRPSTPLGNGGTDEPTATLQRPSSILQKRCAVWQGQLRPFLPLNPLECTDRTLEDESGLVVKSWFRWQFEDGVSISFAYHLIGRGWAECTIAINGQLATLTASYLSDAFGDFLGAVIRMVEGQPEATASFAEEPGEYRWRFIRKEPGRLLIRILEFPQLWGDRPDEEGTVLFEAECRLRTFAGAVLSESQRLLEEHGCDGYLRMWHQHKFPLEKQELLRLVLQNGKRGEVGN